MKTRKQLFNGRLYLEGLKRLRIVGLAMAILCIAICVIIPVSVWTDTARYDVHDTVMIDPVTGVIIEGEQNDEYVRPVKELEDAAIAVPALVTSYLAPLFIFFMFSYLNKRNESDFYHAIPYTRICVYISFSAAVLSWVFGILITSSLAAGLLWALCPYTTFSFAGLLIQMFYMCLNAGMLMGITSVAVALMGTFGTAAVAACVLLASWRVIMGLGGLYLSDVNYMLRFEDILGGYLSPNMLLPVHLITNEANVERGGVLIYAALVMIVTFALGGFLYARRRSETAGRAVPAKWLQFTVRCLLALPIALVLTYMLMVDGVSEASTLIVLLVVMLLAFYLYELLTSKSVRSMLRATPWLGVVVGVCILFGCVLGLANYTVNNENIDENRIVAVGVDASRAPGDYGISSYEMMQLEDYLTRDDQAAEIVARTLAKTQHAVRTNNYYFDRVAGDSIVYSSEYVYTRIKLNSGLTITRRLRFASEDYRTLLEILCEEKQVDPVPVVGDVDYINLQLMEGYRTTVVDKAQYRALLATMREEYHTMTEAQRARFISGDSWQGTDGYVLSMRVEHDKDMTYLSYAIMSDAMPRTYSLLSTVAYGAFADTQEVERLLAALESGGEDTSMEIAVRMSDYEKTRSYGYYTAATFCEVIDFLRSHMKDVEPTSSEVLTYVLIRADKLKYNVKTEDVEITDYTAPSVTVDGNDYYYYEEILFRVALKPVEQHELMILLDRAHKINTGEITLDEKK